MSEVRYLVCPGWVTSASDGDRHFVTVEQLVRLYGLEPGTYAVYDFRKPYAREQTGLVALHPRSGGRYELPS